LQRKLAKAFFDLTWGDETTGLIRWKPLTVSTDATLRMQCRKESDRINRRWLHIDHFRTKKALNVPFALEFVNAHLVTGKYPTVRKIPELVKFRDVPNQPMHQFPFVRKFDRHLNQIQGVK
jgi:hypothetical protein